jgi:hypothetical protein
MRSKLQWHGRLARDSSEKPTGVAPVPLICANPIQQRQTMSFTNKFFTLAIVLAASIGSSVVYAEPRTFTVAADGSGDYKTIQSAINAAPDNNAATLILRIKPGTYKEKIIVPRNKPFLSFLGEDARTTILTNDWNARHVGPAGREVGTLGSASVRIDAPDFRAENITFQNTAGEGGQAVALAATADRQIFRNCRMIGWQDTLYANGGRQYYDHCHIEGRVDFIFGNATAVFDHCLIHSKNGGHPVGLHLPRLQADRRSHSLEKFIRHTARQSRSKRRPRPPLASLCLGHICPLRFGRPHQAARLESMASGRWNGQDCSLCRILLHRPGRRPHKASSVGQGTDRSACQRAHGREAAVRQRSMEPKAMMHRAVATTRAREKEDSPIVVTTKVLSPHFLAHLRPSA